MWIIPTISRPEQCTQVLQRLIDHGITTPGRVMVEGDMDYSGLVLPKDWEIIFTRDFTDKRLGAIGTFNLAFNLMPNEPWYGLFADDEFLMPESPPDWDLRMIAAAGKWDFAHGWDTFSKGTRAHGFFCAGGDLVRAVGYLGVPQCWHNFGVDCMWEWMAGHPAFGGGGACRNIYVPEVKMFHKHPYAGECEIDKCYEISISKFKDDQNAFWDWITKELPAIGQRVRKLKAEANVA